MEMREKEMENWSKGHLCCRVAKNLAELCPCPEILRKAELKSDGLENGSLLSAFWHKAS
jgi:hypothetical protein